MTPINTLVSLNPKADTHLTVVSDPCCSFQMRLSRLIPERIVCPGDQVTNENSQAVGRGGGKFLGGYFYHFRNVEWIASVPAGRFIIHPPSCPSIPPTSLQGPPLGAKRSSRSKENHSLTVSFTRAMDLGKPKGDKGSQPRHLSPP